MHPDIAGYLEGEARADLTRLETALETKVIVQAVDKQPHRDEFEIRLR